MLRSRCSRSIVGLSVCGVLAVAPATETDQFSVPTGYALVDLGPAFSRQAYHALQDAARSLNVRIRDDLDRDPSGRRAQRWYRPEEVARAVRGQYLQAQLLIEGLERRLFSERFLRRHPGRIGAYKDHDSIYSGRSLLDPGWAFTLHISSTIRVAGVDMGTDKIGHFFDKGSILAQMYYTRRNRGKSEEQAMDEVVRIGSVEGIILGEDAVLGSWSSGVYSNGDLACDFAGMMFYRNLSEEIRVADEVWPPMLVLEDGFWRLNDHVTPDSDFLTRFLSTHFNEALNPGVYHAGLREHVRRVVRERGPRLLDWYADTNGAWHPKGYFDNLVRDLSTWFGYEYGHRGNLDDLVLISRCAYPPDESDDPFAMAREGDIDALTAWLDEHDPRQARGRQGESLVHACVRRPDLLRVVLDHGLDANATDERGRTPLHWAARIGSTQSVMLLLEHGASVSARDHRGRTPMHDAALAGHGAIIDTLRAHGAQVDARDNEQVTPMMLACARGHDHILEHLMGSDIDACDAWGWSAAHHAARAAHAPCLRRLGALGADLDARDASGIRPAHLAARSGSIRCLRTLYELGADLLSASDLGSTPLHEAARSGDSASVDFLLRLGAAPDAPDISGRTPRQIADAFDHDRAENLIRLAQLGREDLLAQLRSLRP